MKKGYALAYLAALALVAAGSLFSIAASAEDKAKPKSTSQEKMMPETAKPEAKKPKDADPDAMKSTDPKSEHSESDQMGGDDMGTQD
jgi:hypothetical protein